MDTSATQAPILVASSSPWHPVALADQLVQPGDYRPVEVEGEPLVVLRNRDGELRTLSRVCRHRGFGHARGRGPGGWQSQHRRRQRETAQLSLPRVDL